MIYVWILLLLFNASTTYNNYKSKEEKRVPLMMSSFSTGIAFACLIYNIAKIS
jgi:glycerol uptake facilitator-like aquaporin